MAEKSNNRTDRLFSDNDDCPNLLYLATTKQINYHQPGRKGDTNSTNINLMDDTTDEFEKLNVKRNSASQSAAPGPAGAGPGTGSGPGSSGQAQGGPAPGPGGGPTPGAVGATKSMTLPMDIHTVPPIGAIAIGIGIDTLLNEDYDVNVKKDIQSSASGSASGSGSGFAGSSPMPSRSAFSKDVHGADRDHVDVHEYGPGDDFTIVSTAPPMASTAVDSTSTTTRNRTDIATSQIDRSLNRKSSQSTNIVHLADKLPNVNCPEKIVICLDISHEMDVSSFLSRSGDSFTPLHLLKRSLHIFLNMKHQLNAKHEFALVVLRDTAMWMSNFTCDPHKLLVILEDLKDTYDTHNCHLGSLLDLLLQQVRLPEVTEASLLAPPYIVRVILLYGRSHCVPTYNLTKPQQEFKLSPFFFLDTLYVHDPPSSEDNICEAIFERLCDIDERGDCYVLEVSRNPTKLHECVAQLLAHPLQRPLHADCHYHIGDTDDDPA